METALIMGGALMVGILILVGVTGQTKRRRNAGDGGDGSVAGSSGDNGCDPGSAGDGGCDGGGGDGGGGGD